MRNLVVCAAVLLLAGCVTTKSVMQSWEGHSESELVSAWGAPTSSLDTRDGMRVETWEERWGNFGQNTCRKSFTVDGGGNIVRWSYQGCPI